MYLYDFGDSWEHESLIKKRLLRNKQMNYPVCVDGKLNCPPEDCGGIPGFYELLRILSDKRHPERKKMLAWLGLPKCSTGRKSTASCQLVFIESRQASPIYTWVMAECC